MAQSLQGFHHIIDILVPQDHNRRSTYATCGSVKPTPSFRVPHGPEWCRSKRPSPRPYTPTHMDHRNALLRGPSHLSMQLQVRSRVRSAICSQDTRRSGRDTAIRACTSCSRRALAPRQWREQHQHAHCDHHIAHAPLAALSHCSPYPHAWLAQIVCLKRAPGRCGRPSAAASPRCRSSPGWTP